MRNKLVRAMLLVLAFSTMPAWSRNKAYDDYIRTYSSLAQEHMKKYKIPASITLAQGLLESGAGKARLARLGNNHFGIKCHDWNGARIYHDDDAIGECFRKYKNAKDSFEDHSLFLTQKPRYAFLFKLNVRDYKGWAKGLQKAGYATDRNYANKLIKIIEDNELYRYDTAKTKKKNSQKQVINPHQVYRSNNMLYVVARGDDSFGSIAKEFGFRERTIANYNELPADAPLMDGDLVYLEKKNKKAAPKYQTHRVQAGESMHSISQMYGIRMKYLYKMNKKDGDYVPDEGDLLKVR